MRHVALIAVVFGAFAYGVHAQDGRAGQAPVFRSGADLVALNVTVTKGPQLVTGLSRDDFAVFEDGVQQPVQFFEARDIPLDLVLLIDTSSSMREQMALVHGAAVGFIRTLRDEDRGAIVAFGDSVQMVQTLTSDKGALEQAIRSTNGYGGTALHNAIYVSLNQYGRKARDSSEIRRQAFAVLSDGQDTASLLSFEDVLNQARRNGVTIYTINLRSDFVPNAARLLRRASEAEFSMRVLARETGGQAFVAEHVRELTTIYGGIAEELASQYSIGYTPTNTTADGKLRTVDVRVTTRPELRARTRTGYLAAGTSVTGGAPAGIR